MGKSDANECIESSLSNCRVQLALSTKKDGMILEQYLYDEKAYWLKEQYDGTDHRYPYFKPFLSLYSNQSTRTSSKLHLN